MISIGQYNDLSILRMTTVGLFLGDEEGEDVLLPSKYCPEEYSLGDVLTVFVYRDHDGKKIATNLEPYLLLHQFGFLKVTAVSSFGAFVDWGMVKNLLVPFKEQRQKLEVGRWYIIYMDLDKETDRLIGSNKIEKYLNNENLTVEEGDQVELLVMHKSDLGYSVIVNHLHKGLIFENEIFGEIKVGDKLTGYVKKIRSENKLDISLHPQGYKKSIEPHAQIILTKLNEEDGFLPYHDKTSPELIYSAFHLSKKAFKKAVGNLFKNKLIRLDEEGIHLIQVAQEEPEKSSE
ncbi:CvfB family protein [Namhaeicola litoreus]|uniref:S1 RNA-binding domain-containing protein n=1 Tax=Namhaeicola litoreus TaxID=1052145 RepID=A0ABW3XZC9_9FLAO